MSKQKINNIVFSTPGNNKKNSPIFNRGRRDYKIVLDKAQEHFFSNLSLEQRREEVIKKFGENTKILENGRFGISKDEASFDEEMNRCDNKIQKIVQEINNGHFYCDFCGEKVILLEYSNDNLSKNRAEFSHFLAKSEIYFRQMSENITFSHKVCNRIWGDINDAKEAKTLFFILEKILNNKSKLLQIVEEVEKKQQEYEYDENNKPRFKK